jgi:hypothetical protein
VHVQTMTSFMIAMYTDNARCRRRARHRESTPEPGLDASRTATSAKSIDFFPIMVKNQLIYGNNTNCVVSASLHC